MKRRSSLLRRALPAVALTIVAGLIAAAWLVPPRVERAVRARIEREAARRGIAIQVERVRVGPWPPLRLDGVRVEKPGGWSFTAESVGVTLRPWGRGLVGRTRLALGATRVTGPGGLALESVPAIWDVVTPGPGAMGADIRRPAAGLAATWVPGAGGGVLEVRASAFPAGQVFAVQRDYVPLLDAGTVSGSFRVTTTPGATTFDVDADGHALRLAALSNESLFSGEPPAFGVPTDVTVKLTGSWHPVEGALDVPHWRVTSDGAVLSGSLALAEVPKDPRLDLSLEVEHLDFAQVLGTSGLDEPGSTAPVGGAMPEPRDLGSASLSARATGRLAEPASFAVTQRLDFTPPKKPVPAIEKLRGSFVHVVTLPGGGRRAITVSPESPDFVPYGDVPALFVRTLLLAEDAGFFGHRGIDLSEVPSAILTNWTKGGIARGASTITQQLAKNLFLSREKRLGRKLQELSLALLIEASLQKERILEIYLNVIEWGPDLYGLRPAAQHYFGVEPRALTPRQMAFLVALIPGPVKYQRSFAGGILSPGFRPLVDNLLAKVRSIDLLSEEDYQAALAEELHIGAVPAAEQPSP